MAKLPVTKKSQKTNAKNEQEVAISNDGRKQNGRPAHQDIALLAYAYWEQRGYPEGSPDEDWLRAELDLIEKSTRF